MHEVCTVLGRSRLIVGRAGGSRRHVETFEAAVKGEMSENSMGECMQSGKQTRVWPRSGPFIERGSEGVETVS